MVNDGADIVKREQSHCHSKKVHEACSGFSEYDFCCDQADTDLEHLLHFLQSETQGQHAFVEQWLQGFNQQLSALQMPGSKQRQQQAGEAIERLLTMPLDFTLNWKPAVKQLQQKLQQVAQPAAGHSDEALPSGTMLASIEPSQEAAEDYGPLAAQVSSQSTALLSMANIMGLGSMQRLAYTFTAQGYKLNPMLSCSSLLHVMLQIACIWTADFSCQNSTSKHHWQFISFSKGMCKETQITD